MTRNYAEWIASDLHLSHSQVASAIGLLDEDNTIPFIARYRKELTGGLDETQLRDVQSNLEKLRKLDERRTTILATIKDQGKLSSELRQRIDNAETLGQLEDLYQPYKPRRKTRADIAREYGLQPLAERILKQPGGTDAPEEFAKSFLNEHVHSVDDALSAARDIVAEVIAEHPDVRSMLRKKTRQWGRLLVQKIKNAVDEKGIYNNYYDFDLRLDRLRPHQILAINRGEQEKILRVKVDVPERDWRGIVNDFFPVKNHSRFASQLSAAVDDAASRLLLPAIERVVRRTLTEEAQTHAIHVFSTNLKALLTLPPLSGYCVLGIDPGYRTGCKVAVVDQTGKVLETGTIYPHPPQNQRKETRMALQAMIAQHKVDLIAIGNGTASRETELLAASLTEENNRIKYLIVNEAGASVYSASPLAKAELPELDVSIRGAVSIARRVQDPLAELVKIDPKSVGVGMYQHDLNQKTLANALNDVVESVVNQVGVDANTASPALLAYVAGIGGKLAEKIVQHRNQHGPFKNRRAIRLVAGLGPKAFEQAAGFLRIRDGSNPLDASAIHPESYSVAAAVLKSADIAPGAPQQDRQDKLVNFLAAHPVEVLAEQLGTGIPTLEDIFEQLISPGRDPRQDLPAPILRSDVLSIDDLKTGTTLKGTVRNVVDFGAFVDIGVKQDGLLHRSQIPTGIQVSVGEVIDVVIQNVDKDRGRIGLSWSHSGDA